ncbi:hypothetical protein PMKS-003713 [Pichia membranifaciens]|uniref:Uncharacterized protein n=1 Tax=Pichia membranifaciens TaxID=4926 RepID=A0A1Q2YKZ8_9ASCO|nr:hypothetical protein PMKS-003713 [Pichia membranifaciens]
MGRLFRQQSSSAVHSHSKQLSDQSLNHHHAPHLHYPQAQAHPEALSNSHNMSGTTPSMNNSSSISNTASSTTNIAAAYANANASTNPNTASNGTLNGAGHPNLAGSTTTAGQEDSIAPHDGQQDINFVHSNSSSISSQVGSSTSSSTTPSISSNQTTRKFGFPMAGVVGISSPEIVSPNTYSNVSVSTIVTNPDSMVSQDESMKLKYRENFSKMSTLSEKVDISLDTLLSMSKKFVFFHRRFLSTLESLNISISLSKTNFNVYLTVLDNVERKFVQKGHEQITESMKAHLKASLVNSMKDLRKYIENLKLYFKSSNLDVTISSLRMSYFTLFSLFIELANICKFIVPFSNRNTHFSQNGQSSGSINNNPSTVRLNNSSISKNKPPFIINRVPPPNPQVSSQIASSRQASLSRQHSKLDRQDSDLSTSSSQAAETSNNSVMEDEKLFDLIAHTVQAAHVVYSQMNEAIAKSAIMIAENRNSDIEDQTTDSEDEKSVSVNTIAMKVKELTNQCLASMEQTKNVENCLTIVKNPNFSASSDTDAHRNIYEQTNLFLKSIISILAATKSAIEDIPALNEVRSSLSILTRATKELTIKLESSSLKQSVLNNTPSTTSLVDQPNLSSIPSMGNLTFDQQQQQQSIVQGIQSPVLQQQMESNSIRRINKLRQIPEHNENMMGTMKQHIMNLELSAGEMFNQPSLGVTTPLIASIGPAVANAVLPIKSPLKTASTANLNSTFKSNTSTIDGTLNGGNTSTGATTPLYFGDGNMQAEYNPFDRLVPRGQQN